VLRLVGLTQDFLGFTHEGSSCRSELDCAFGAEKQLIEMQRKRVGFGGEFSA